MELQQSSKKKAASTALFKESENQSRVWSTIIYWHYYDSPEENKWHGFQKIPKILQQRNSYLENVTSSEEPELHLIHFTPSLLLSNIPKRELHQLKPDFIWAGKSERNFRAALLSHPVIPGKTWQVGPQGYNKGQ